jgi:vacuolar-type H+-ATPase subunit I/STV1
MDIADIINAFQYKRLFIVIRKHYIPALLSALILSGCVTLDKTRQNTPAANTEDNRYKAELTERMGQAVDTNEEAAHTMLKQIAQEANERYQSQSPSDRLSLFLSGITYIEDGHAYNMRDVNVIVSRGDSRIINTTDTQVRYSGVEESIRVTHALNGTIWVNGKQVGFYNPSESNYWDARVKSIVNPGVITLRATY